MRDDDRPCPSRQFLVPQQRDASGLEADLLRAGNRVGGRKREMDGPAAAGLEIAAGMDDVVGWIPFPRTADRPQGIHASQAGKSLGKAGASRPTQGPTSRISPLLFFPTLCHVRVTCGQLRLLGTISVNTVTELKAEAFYWVTIMFSQTLGTALGDWMADSTGLGYEGGALVFGAALAVVAAFYYWTRVSRTALFWAAFILTRPLGATLGDFLEHGRLLNPGSGHSPKEAGGRHPTLTGRSRFPKADSPENSRQLKSGRSGGGFLLS